MTTVPDTVASQLLDSLIYRYLIAKLSRCHCSPCINASTLKFKVHMHPKKWSINAPLKLSDGVHCPSMNTVRVKFGRIVPCQFHYAPAKFNAVPAAYTIPDDVHAVMFEMCRLRRLLLTLQRLAISLCHPGANSAAVPPHFLSYKTSKNILLSTNCTQTALCTCMRRRRRCRLPQMYNRASNSVRDHSGWSSAVRKEVI